MLGDMVFDDPIQHEQTDQARVQSFAFVISVGICVWLSSGSLLDIAWAGRPCSAQLASRINPNDAPPASLVRLSGIGPSRAAAIVAYRDAVRRQGADVPAFRDCNDLQNVKGIGPKTAEDICGWLEFD